MPDDTGRLVTMFLGGMLLEKALVPLVLLLSCRARVELRAA